MPGTTQCLLRTLRHHLVAVSDAHAHFISYIDTLQVKQMESNRQPNGE